VELERLIIVLAVTGVVSLLIWQLSKPYPVPLWVAYRARQRIDLVHPGMTDAQVWETLRLSHSKFFKGAEGSGPRNNFPMNYRL
jgi:hypothetical protein